MNRIAPLALFISLSSFVAAQTPQVTIAMKDGSRYAFALDEIRKITFDSPLITAGNPQFQNLLRSFALFQNFPNPFNPSTTIRYELPQVGNVRISVFAITGQLVKVIADELQGPGSHEVVWDGTSDARRPVASGLYFYRVTFGQTTFQRKMLFLK